MQVWKLLLPLLLTSPRTSQSSLQPAECTYIQRARNSVHSGESKRNLLLRGAEGNFGDPRHGFSLFFRLTAARNGRIPVVPQPRIEGRGVHQGALPRPCSPATLGEQIPGARALRTGNKFGRSQVLLVVWDSDVDFLEGASNARRPGSFDFSCVRVIRKCALPFASSGRLTGLAKFAGSFLNARFR